MGQFVNKINFTNSIDKLLNIIQLIFEQSIAQLVNKINFPNPLDKLLKFLEPFQMLLSQDLRILTEVLQVTDRGIGQLSCQDQVSAHWFKTTNPGIKMDGKPGVNPTSFIQPKSPRDGLQTPQYESYAWNLSMNSLVRTPLNVKLL